LVASGEAEFGITIVSANSEHTSAVPLFTEDYHLVCSADHRLANSAQVNWSDLRNERLVRVGPETANRYVIDQALGSAIESHQWAFEVQHSATAIELVRNGVALTIAPASATRSIIGEELSAVPLRRPRVTRTVGILTRRGSDLSQTAAELVGDIKCALGVETKSHKNRNRRQ
jgi:DNA-binding transcriptional LysR family regulator